MKYIKSCGFVAFRRVNGENQYLLIKSLNGDVGFPKGHTEPGESEIETAIRELKEETGADVKIIPGFVRQIEYPLPRMTNTVKQSVYFLGECITDEITCQECEVADAAFLSYHEALSRLTFDETKSILSDAECFINQYDFCTNTPIDREVIRKALQCRIYPTWYLGQYKYTVICSNYGGKWILSKHKKRNTWETQGGHIEDGEAPLECARRELFEESGIKDADIYPVCDYWGYNSRSCSNGMVFLAVVHSLGELPESEMKEIGLFDILPAELTYPQTSPKLYAEAEKVLNKINMTVNCVWEHNGDDTLLYAVNYIGAYTRGESLEIAKEKMTEEIKSYLKWLGKDITENIEIVIVGEKKSELDIKDADSDMIFESEKEPLTVEEYERLKHLALKSAKDFLILYNSIPDKNATASSERKTFYGTVPRSADEMYLHTKNVNEYYFTEIEVDADNCGDIYECRKRGFEALEAKTDFLQNAVIEGSYGEEWSLRKLIRRFIWHDRIHAKAMYRMAVKVFGADKINNSFYF